MITVATGGVKASLDDHMGDEMSGLTGLVQELLDLGLGRDGAVLLELLADLSRRAVDHHGVSSEGLARRPQQSSIRAQGFPRCRHSRRLRFPMESEFLYRIGFVKTG